MSDDRRNRPRQLRLRHSGGRRHARSVRLGDVLQTDSDPSRDAGGRPQSTLRVSIQHISCKTLLRFKEISKKQEFTKCGDKNICIFTTCSVERLLLRVFVFGWWCRPQQVDCCGCTHLSSPDAFVLLVNSKVVLYSVLRSFFVYSVKGQFYHDGFYPSSAFASTAHQAGKMMQSSVQQQRMLH